MSSASRMSCGDVDEAALASASLARRYSRSKKAMTDPAYSACLCLRGEPLPVFLGESKPRWPLPITSINEDRLLQELGMKVSERKQLEGLHSERSSVDLHHELGLTLEQLSSRAVVRLAANPPLQVGHMQRLTAKHSLRPYPLGLRFSGANMRPEACWLTGAQHVALNMCNNDTPVELHFALFHGSRGFLLKPPEMRLPASSLPSAGHKGIGLGKASSSAAVADPGEHATGSNDDDAFWPPPREKLHRTTVQVVSLHNLPKRGEHRPHRAGECHKYIPELSGTFAPPNCTESSSPALKLSLLPVGGICAISKSLPLPLNLETEGTTRAARRNGMNAPFGDTFHCVAAEPHATFLRIAVTDERGDEVAYVTAVLGRLRQGYRVLMMRGLLGVRIELCCLFVRISYGSELNMWLTTRQLRLMIRS